MDIKEQIGEQTMVRKSVREFVIHTTRETSGFYPIYEKGDRIGEVANLHLEVVLTNLATITGSPACQFSLVEELPYAHLYALEEGEKVENEFCNDLVQTKKLHATIIAAGPLTKKPEKIPSRTILVNLGRQFAVYEETFTDSCALDGNLVPYANSELWTNGEYFDELTQAIICFAERVRHSVD